jgi:hypothetical protein
MIDYQYRERQRWIQEICRNIDRLKYWKAKMQLERDAPGASMGGSALRAKSKKNSTVTSSA